MRQDRHEQFSKEFAVDVDVIHLLTIVFDHTEVRLEVANHVTDDESDTDDAGDRHHILLADCG